MLECKSQGELTYMLNVTKSDLADVANKLVDLMLNFSTNEAEKTKLMFTRYVSLQGAQCGNGFAGTSSQSK